MKIAVVFNESFPQLTDHYSKSSSKEFKETHFYKTRGGDLIAEYQYIADLLIKAGFDSYIVNLLDDINVLFSDLVKNKPDVIFNLVEIFHEKSGLEKSFAGILELLSIPYTGSDPIALGLCQNKNLTKRILSTYGINTPKFKLITKFSKIYRAGFDYPIIVKPAMEDASIGIENESIVFNHHELKERIEYVLTKHKQPALIEQYIEGRELNLAVIGTKNPRVLPISEIDFSEMPNTSHNIVSFQAKWDPQHESYKKTIPICPANLSKDIEKTAKEMAIASFKAVNCRDYARVDMRLSKDNKLYVLEVNPNPDLSEDAGFARSAKAAGISYKKICRLIVESAITRKH
ncbi:MAG: ATP-grasp domain-containing protein [bacterium]